MEWLVSDETGLDKVVAYLVQQLANSKIIGFRGELGAGKTTLIKSLVLALGSQDEVSSPTFSIINEYSGMEGPIYHMDMYRLKEIEEALDIGIEEYLFSGHVCLIEWPELITDLLPPEYVDVEIQVLPDSSRKILV